ncbi:MAG: hypothetical protein RIF32_16430 [Leptospirales bacterium]|jgi:hypothetical protein
MEFTHRTVLRHAAVFTALVLLPFAMMTGSDAVQWYQRHAVFFVALALSGFVIGLGASLMVRRGYPAQWIADPPEKLSDLAYLRRLLYQWASCSRCVAYWLAAGAIGVLSWIFWPIAGHNLWALVLRTMYFAVMGGSLAGAVAVLLYLSPYGSDRQT